MEQHKPILTAADIDRILHRMAFQILEKQPDEESPIYLIGIQKNGVLIAERLFDLIQSIRPHSKINKGSIQIDKANPRKTVECSIPLAAMEKSIIIVIDDVLNTGSTLMYAIRHFLEIPVRQLKAAVLVNRSHKTFPVKAEIKGISLSTSMNEHVEVELHQQIGVYLR